MCQAVMYLAQDGQETELMRDVTLLEPVREGLHRQAFFEKPVVVRAHVGRIDFLKRTATLVPEPE